MKITKITAAVKTSGRYNIFVDEKYSFSLNETQLLEEKIKLNLEIDEIRLSKLKSESDFGKNYAKSLDLILRRPRSEKEIYEYARKKNWENEMTIRVIDKLKKRGYIDDKKFADFWVKSRVFSAKPISRNKLFYELLQKGLNDEIIKGSIQKYSDEEELKNLKKLINKKISKYDDNSKFINYLASKGYNYGLIKKALEETSL